MESRNEVSAGGVVYRRGGDGIEIALAARRTRRGDLAWGLAKGAMEPGESEEQAAVREVLEETGLEVDVEADLGDIRYFYVWEGVRVRKRVHFFLMWRTSGGSRCIRPSSVPRTRANARSSSARSNG
jgi:8-oxo-dGTP pyrophosphatase MutT (NUDIX family)